MYPLTLDTFPPEVISDMVAFTSDAVADAVEQFGDGSIELLCALAVWEEWAV
jgi:hypothetical protein